MVKRIKLRKMWFVSKKGKVKERDEEEQPFFGISETAHQGKRKAEIIYSRNDAGLETMDVASATSDAGISRAPDSVLESRRIVQGRRPIAQMKDTNTNRFKKMKTAETATITGPKENEEFSFVHENYQPISLPTVLGALKSTAFAGKRKAETELTVGNWDLDVECAAPSDGFVRAPDSVLANRRMVHLQDSSKFTSSVDSSLSSASLSGVTTPKRAACLRRKGVQQTHSTVEKSVRFAWKTSVRDFKLKIGDLRLCEPISWKVGSTCSVIPVELDNEDWIEYEAPTQRRFETRKYPRRMSNDDQAYRLEASGVTLLEVDVAEAEANRRSNKNKRRRNAGDSATYEFSTPRGRFEFAEACREARKEFLKKRGGIEMTEMTCWEEETAFHASIIREFGVENAQDKAFRLAKKQHRSVTEEE